MSQIVNNIFHRARLEIISKNVTYQSVGYFSKVKATKKVQDVPLYTKRDDEFKISQKVSVKKLEELLNVRPVIAREIVVKYKKFLQISGLNIGENYQCCISNGVMIDTLKKCPEVLAEKDTLIKLNEIKKLPYDVNLTAPLLSLTHLYLKTFVDKESEDQRIALLSRNLGVNEFEVCEFIVRRPFLLTRNLLHIEDNIKLLTEVGITKEQIIKDLWVLSYSTKAIEEKLILAKQNNVDIFKTWMVRAQSSIFDKYIKRRSDTRLILGGSSLAEYLSERLECTEEIAKYIISKQPALENKSLKKMNEMIDFLLMYGFKPIHICRVPKILLHSVETTRKRLKELEALGMHLDALYILTKSQKQYMQYYESLVKTNKSKLKNA